MTEPPLLATGNVDRKFGEFQTNANLLYSSTLY